MGRQNVLSEEKWTPGFYQQLYTRGAHEVPKKKNELGFEIDLPVNETQFSKTTINNLIFHIS